MIAPTTNPTPTYQRGEMSLYLGDCLDILPRLAESSVGAVFCDPPYGHNNNDGDLAANIEAALGRGESGDARPIMNDGPEANGLFRDALPLMRRVIMPGACCCCCCCGGGGPDPQFARWSMWMDEVFDFKQMIVWDKGPMGLGWHYRRSYETILVGQKPGKKCRWFDLSAKIENIIRPNTLGIRKIIPSIKQHPTEKPWQLAAHFIRLHSDVGDVVLDPFMGGGATAYAAHVLGRKFIGIELDPVFFDMAVKRADAATTSTSLFDAATKAVCIGGAA